ncbi:MAG: glycosyltransferase family 9 protein [Thermodesulfovibrionales bacterium]|nr:glycosyltransferase family 9 protein [Thermodesulfovibrionales bacterium]
MQGLSNTVFIYHPGTLGDILLSIPTIEMIKSIEKSSVHICCRHYIAKFLKDISVADEISDIDSIFYSPLFTDDYRRLCDFFSRFKRIFLFIKNRQNPILQNLKKISKNIQVIETIPKDNTHVALYRLKQFENVDVINLKKIHIKDDFLIHAKRLCRLPTARFIVIHPGSGSKNKNLPLDDFFTISDYVIDTLKVGVLFITGQDEDKDMIRKIDEYVIKKSGFAQHINNTTLMTVSALISLSSLYIGNDSGISHLAGLLNKSMIVFFKASDPSLWSPLGDDVSVIDKGFNLADIFRLISEKLARNNSKS